MNHHTSEVVTAVLTGATIFIKMLGQALPTDWTWVSSLGAPGCMAIAIFFLLKDRAALIRELNASREKYEAALKEIAAKAEKRADEHQQD